MSFQSHTLREVEALYGKLTHAAHLVPFGRAYLTGLEAMNSIFGDNPECSRHAPKSVGPDLIQWSRKLCEPEIGRAFLQPQNLELRVLNGQPGCLRTGLIRFNVHFCSYFVLTLVAIIGSVYWMGWSLHFHSDKKCHQQNLFQILLVFSYTQSKFSISSH